MDFSRSIYMYIRFKTTLFFPTGNRVPQMLYVWFYVLAMRCIPIHFWCSVEWAREGRGGAEEKGGGSVGCMVVWIAWRFEQCLAQWLVLMGLFVGVRWMGGSVIIVFTVMFLGSTSVEIPGPPLLPCTVDFKVDKLIVTVRPVFTVTKLYRDPPQSAPAPLLSGWNLLAVCCQVKMMHTSATGLAVVRAASLLSEIARLLSSSFLWWKLKVNPFVGFFWWKWPARGFLILF